MKLKEITTKNDLFFICDLLENSNIKYWIDGGWGVDIIKGEQTRNHRDIDINFDAEHTEKLLELLLEKNYQINIDLRPTRIELYDAKHGYLDIHPFVLNSDGSSKQKGLNDEWYVFEKDYFDVLCFNGRKIPCISLKGQLIFHSYYELREKDKQDLEVLNSIACIKNHK